MLNELYREPSDRHRQSSPGPKTTILVGPQHCGKTSIAFRLACEEACEKNEPVLFICTQNKFEQQLPMVVQLDDDIISYDAEILSRIQVKYVNNLADLVRTINMLHMPIYDAKKKQLPSLIHTVVIDDLLSLVMDHVSANSSLSSASFPINNQLNLQAAAMREQRAATLLPIVGELIEILKYLSHTGNNTSSLSTRAFSAHCIITITSDIPELDHLEMTVLAKLSPLFVSLQKKPLSSMSPMPVGYDLLVCDKQTFLEKRLQSSTASTGYKYACLFSAVAVGHGFIQVMNRNKELNNLKT